MPHASTIRRLEPLHRFLTLELLGVAAGSGFVMLFAYHMLLPLARVAAFTFAPYVLWVLFQEKRWGWLTFFALLVGVPTVGAVFSEGSTAAIFDGTALVAFYLYCLLLKHAVGQWLAEAREWHHFHAMTPTA